MDIGCIGAPFEVKFADSEAMPGSFEGYGAVFGNIDSHGDVVEPGAFAKSLLERSRDGASLPPMYKMHGAMTGNRHEPIGVWEQMSEDTNGLFVKGRLIGLDTEQGKWNYSQLREGALKGLSIGYRVMPNGARKGSDRVGEPKRYIKAVHLREVSLVDDPSNVRARVHSMKAASEDLVGAIGWLRKAIDLHAGHMDGSVPTDDDSQREMMDQMKRAFALLTEDIPSEMSGMKTIREFEDFLRDVGGFSHAAAKAISAGGFKAQLDPRDEDRGSAVAAIIQEAANRIRAR